MKFSSLFSSFFSIFTLTVTQLTSKYCSAERPTITAFNVKGTTDKKSLNEQKSTLVGLIKSDNVANMRVPEQAPAILEALKFVQSFIYTIIERFKEMQLKVDSLITQPLTHFFRFAGYQGSLHNDHVDCNIETLGLTDCKLKKVYDVLSKEVLQNKDLMRRANATHLNVNPHLIYRYMTAVDWAKKYNGRSYEEAITDTIEWREQSGITTIDTSLISHLITSGLGYTNGCDKYGRAIVYVKIGRNPKLETRDTYTKLLMYTVERADRMCVENGCGEFVSIIDLDGFKFTSNIPLRMIKEAINVLKQHYPYRLGGVYIINGSPAFSFFWNMIKPLVPRKVLVKTFVVGKKDASRTIVEKLGKEFVEEGYGGDIKEDHGDANKYFAQGYWPRK